MLNPHFGNGGDSGGEIDGVGEVRKGGRGRGREREREREVVGRFDSVSVVEQDGQDGWCDRCPSSERSG